MVCKNDRSRIIIRRQNKHLIAIEVFIQFENSDWSTTWKTDNDAITVHLNLSSTIVIKSRKSHRPV